MPTSGKPRNLSVITETVEVKKMAEETKIINPVDKVSQAMAGMMDFVMQGKVADINKALDALKVKTQAANESIKQATTQAQSIANNVKKDVLAHQSQKEAEYAQTFDTLQKRFDGITVNIANLETSIEQSRKELVQKQQASLSVLETKLVELINRVSRAQSADHKLIEEIQKWIKQLVVHFQSTNVGSPEK